MSFSFLVPRSCGSAVCAAFEPRRHILGPITHAASDFYIRQRIAARTAPGGERAVRQTEGGGHLIGREQIGGEGRKRGDGSERCLSHLAFPVVVKGYRANAKCRKGNEQWFISLLREFGLVEWTGLSIRVVIKLSREA